MLITTILIDYVQVFYDHDPGDHQIWLRVSFVSCPSPRPSRDEEGPITPPLRVVTGDRLLFYGVCILFGPTGNLKFVASKEVDGTLLCSANNKLYLYYNIIHLESVVHSRTRGGELTHSARGGTRADQATTEQLNLGRITLSDSVLGDERFTAWLGWTSIHG